MSTAQTQCMGGPLSWSNVDVLMSRLLTWLMYSRLLVSARRLHSAVSAEEASAKHQ